MFIKINVLNQNNIYIYIFVNAKFVCYFIRFFETLYKIILLLTSFHIITLVYIFEHTRGLTYTRLNQLYIRQKKRTVSKI